MWSIGFFKTTGFRFFKKPRFRALGLNVELGVQGFGLSAWKGLATSPLAGEL